MTKDEFIFSKVWPGKCLHKITYSYDSKLWVCTCEFATPQPREYENHIARHPVPDFATWDGFGMLLEEMEISGIIVFKVGNQSISLPASTLVDKTGRLRDAIFKWLGGEEPQIKENSFHESPACDSDAHRSMLMNVNRRWD